MSDFDKRTEILANQFVSEVPKPHQLEPGYRVEFEAFKAGRDSLKDSFLILCRAIDFCADDLDCLTARLARKTVKLNGDWVGPKIY